MYEITEGAQYAATRNLDITEIAKRVRTDLRTVQKNGGVFPAEMTFSVRIDRFSGGQSLDVTLSGMPDSWIYNQPGLEPNYAEYIPAHGGQTDAAREAVRTAERIVSAYNYDGSDVQSDYFNVRFYSNVKIQDEREQAFWAAEKERKAARRLARKR